MKNEIVDFLTQCMELVDNGDLHIIKRSQLSGMIDFLNQRKVAFVARLRELLTDSEIRRLERHPILNIMLLETHVCLLSVKDCSDLFSILDIVYDNSDKIMSEVFTDSEIVTSAKFIEIVTKRALTKRIPIYG